MAAPRSSAIQVGGTWQRIRSIKARDGCYEAVAIDEKGKSFHGYFNAKRSNLLLKASGETMADQRFSLGSRKANLIRVLILFGPMMIALGLLALFATAHARDRHGVPVQASADTHKSSPQVARPDLVTIDLSGGPFA